MLTKIFSWNIGQPLLNHKEKHLNINQNNYLRGCFLLDIRIIPLDLGEMAPAKIMLKHFCSFFVLIAVVRSLAVADYEIIDNEIESESRNELETELRNEDLCKKYGSKHTMCRPKVGPNCGEGSVIFLLVKQIGTIYLYFLNHL